MAHDRADVDAERLRAAEAAIEAMGARPALEILLGALQGPLVAQLRPHVPAEEARLSQAVEEVLMPSIMEAVGPMIATTAGIYARHFTTEELREIAGFFRLPEPRDRAAFDATPTGRKMLALNDTLNAESHAANSAGMQSAIDDALRRRGVHVRARALEH